MEVKKDGTGMCKLKLNETCREEFRKDEQKTSAVLFVFCNTGILNVDADIDDSDSNKVNYDSFGNHMFWMEKTYGEHMYMPVVSYNIVYKKLLSSIMLFFHACICKRTRKLN